MVREAFAYPKLLEKEKRLKVLKADILPLPEHDASYFSPGWRYADVVIDLLAEKYHGKPQDYPTGGAEEQGRFLLGPKTCQEVMYQRSIHCPFLDKVLEKIKDKDESVIGICIFDPDDSDGSNKQKFVVLTKNLCLIRSEATDMEVREFRYKQLLFDDSSVEVLGDNDCNGLQDDEELDEEFVAFAKEYQLLYCHGFINLTQNFRIKDSIRKDVFQGLCELAVTSGYITVGKLLLLAHLSKENGFGSKSFLNWLNKASEKWKNGRIKPKNLSNLLNKVPIEEKLQVGTLILWQLVNEDGEIDEKIKEKLQEVCGNDFVEKYLKYIYFQQKGTTAKISSLRPRTEKYSKGVPWLKNNFESFLNLQNYLDTMNSEIFRIGVKKNV